MTTYSTVEKVADGSTNQFSIAFTGGYIERDHVSAYVGTEMSPRAITWISDGLVEIAGDTPANGVTVRFQRDTPIDNTINDFQNGTPLMDDTLDQGFQQAVFGLQELRDTVGDTITADQSAAAASADADRAHAAADAAEATVVSSEQVINSAATLLSNAPIVSTGASTYTLERDLPIGLVFIEGVQQSTSSFVHNQSARTITLSANPAVGSSIEVMYSAGTAAYSLLTFENVASFLDATNITYLNTPVGAVVTTRSEKFAWELLAGDAVYSTDPYIVVNGCKFRPAGDTLDIRQVGVLADTVTDGTGGYVAGTDDATALQVAFDIAAGYGMKVVGPKNGTCLYRSDVLAWKVRLIDLGETHFVSDNSSQLAFGGFSQGGGSPLWSVGNVTNGVNLLSGTVPVVAPFRMYGAKRGKLTIGNTNCLELYANSDVTGANANAYMAIHGNGVRRCDRLTDNAGSAFSWNTANKFYGGDVIEVVVVGHTYPHNDNEWFDSTFEGANVAFTFDYAQNNKIYRARLESTAGSTVTCSNNAYGNVVEGANTSTGTVRGLFENPLTLIEDTTSRANVLTMEAVTQWQKTTLFDVSPSTVVLANNTDWCSDCLEIGSSLDPYGGPVITPDLFGAQFTSFDTAALSKMIPVQRGDVFGFDVDVDDGGGALLRPIFYAFDEDFQSVSTAGWLSYNGSVAGVSDGRSYVSTSASLTATTVNANKASIEGSEVAYVRVGLVMYSAGFMRHATAHVYGRPLGFNRQSGAATSNRPPILAGVPTKGFAPVGFVVEDRLSNTKHIATVSRDTFVNGAVSSGSDVNVYDSADVGVNSVVGVAVAGRRTHWTTVTAVSGTLVTLADPVAIADGARIVFNQWATV